MTFVTFAPKVPEMTFVHFSTRGGDYIRDVPNFVSATASAASGKEDRESHLRHRVRDTA